jgi:hypothetical protein
VKTKLPVAAAFAASLLLVLTFARQSLLEGQVGELRAKAKEAREGRRVEFRLGEESATQAGTSARVGDQPVEVGAVVAKASTPGERFGQVADALAGQREVVEEVRKRLAKRDERLALVKVREGMKRVVAENESGGKRSPVCRAPRERTSISNSIRPIGRVRPSRN